MKDFGLKSKIGNMSLHSRLLLYFVIVSIIPILLIGLISYSIAVNIITDRAIQFSKQMIDQVTWEIDNLLLDAYRVSVMVADDLTTQMALRNPLDKDIARRYSTDLIMDTRLNFIQSSYRNEFFGFYVVGANGSKYKSNFYSVKNNDLRLTDWYQKIVKSKAPVWFKTHRGSFVVESLDQLLVSVGFPIIDKATGKTLGVVLIDIDEEIFSDITGSRLGKTGFMFIQDSDNNVISYPDKSLVSLKIPLENNSQQWLSNFSKNRYLMINGHRSMVFYKNSTVNGWKIAGVLPASELTKEGRTVGLVIGGILLAVCVIALIIAWTISGTIVNPIQKLIYLMRKAEEGDLSVTMNVKFNDEIGQLGRSFNIMIGKISKLMDKVFEEQQELRKAEFKALQAQINPHFLYNTLDSIIWLSRAHKDKEVITLATALTKLFRVGLSRGRDIITIQEEFEHINSYLTIQHIRYKNKFTYKIALPEELYPYKTLKLILQPIIENAIYHGIKMKREPGHISVVAYEHMDWIVFEVVDSGIGMTAEQLAALNNTLKNAQGEKLNSYGLRNVNERIKIYFGNEYGLSFWSEYGVGTKMEVKIPKVLEADENVKSSLG
jgi:two-component system sensor histidine kinase YesM